MDTEKDLIGDGMSNDPAVGLRAVAALRRLVDQLEFLQVQNARRLGWSWAEIAAAVGVSKQAVHKKHAGRVTASADKGDRNV
ncbi:helix-turn-helix domain-containing protein [Arthrobacter sp. G119Y2]|uniref:helix-turn-helix domain-containing protein n=1 Tax=Arthrobacter sp. G119Y2 TaxID=3134965 RepID=UPI003119C81C